MFKSKFHKIKSAYFACCDGIPYRVSSVTRWSRATKDTGQPWPARWTSASFLSQNSTSTLHVTSEVIIQHTLSSPKTATAYPGAITASDSIFSFGSFLSLL